MGKMTWPRYALSCLIRADDSVPYWNTIYLFLLFIVKDTISAAIECTVAVATLLLSVFAL